MLKILKTGDKIKFTMMVPGLQIPPIASPVPLIGKGLHTATTPVCVEGDELPLIISTPLPYTQQSFTIPGTGTIELILPLTHKTKTLKDMGRKVLLEGPPFTVQFKVASPAMQPNPPAPPIPDPFISKPLLVEYQSTTVWYKAI